MTTPTTQLEPELPEPAIRQGQNMECGFAECNFYSEDQVIDAIAADRKREGGTDNELPEWIYDIYLYLESTLPEGAADEAFRVAPQAVGEAIAARKAGAGNFTGISVGHTPQVGRVEVAAPVSAGLSDAQTLDLARQTIKSADSIPMGELLAFARALSARLLPEGYVAVPIVPTEEMLDAAFVGQQIHPPYKQHLRAEASNIYKSMIAAAPMEG